MSRHSLPVALLVAIAGGILTGTVWAWPLVPVLSVACISGVFAAYRLYRPDPRSGYAALLAATALFGCATCSARLQENSPAWVTRHRDSVIHVSGIIGGPEREVGGGWSRLVLGVDRVNGAPVARTRVQVISKPSPNLLLPGARVRTAGRLEVFSGPANPGDPDSRLTARAERLQAVLKAWDTPLELVSGPHPLNLIAAVQRLRVALERVHSQTMPPDFAHLLNGIVLGDEQRLDPVWRQWFQRTGTVHILSVSGLHVSLVSLGLFALLRFLKVPTALVIGLVASASMLYVALSGMQPAGLRAAIMSLAALVGRAFGRKTSSPRLLTVAALIMLALDPLLLFDVGFQLSFSATAGVVWIGPALQRRVFRGRWAVLGQAAACSLGAQLAVTPLTAYYFGSLTPISLISNIVMVPLATAALYTGLSAAVSGLIWLPLAQWINRGTGVILWALLQTGRGMSAIPGGCVPVPSPGVHVILVYYACLIGLTLTLTADGRTARVRRIPLGVALVIASLSFSGWSVQRLLDHRERVCLLDVGQGNAALLELDGRWGAIDAGPSASPTGGGADEYLRRRGVRHLSFVILTHAHNDHYSGLAAVLKGRKVDRLIVPHGIYASPDFVRIRALASAERVPIVEARPGTGLQIGGSRLYFLWPPHAQGCGENEGSLVTMVETRSGRVLFPGDVGAAELETLAGQFRGRLQCDVLLVAHHGSIHSLCPRFYAECHPELAVISVGPNRYGHPSDEVVNSLCSACGPVWQTRNEGTVILTAGPGRMERTAWRRRGLFGMWLWREH